MEKPNPKEKPKKLAPLEDIAKTGEKTAEISERDYVMLDQIGKYLRGDDGYLALFLIDNLKGKYNTSALYAAVALNLARTYDQVGMSRDGGKAYEATQQKTLLKQMMDYCAQQMSKIGDYGKGTAPQTSGKGYQASSRAQPASSKVYQR